MIEKLKSGFKENKKTIAILLLIMAVGIFLRTYQYEDLLRFGKDQARDAAIIRDIIENGEDLPLLGPKAGGTEFKMGPIFYYFQYLSAKVFGFSPVAIAFPDLLFSVLAIPVFFLFLRKYFSTRLSLALTALFAVSFFAVQNGRFAWNPNSLPLFTVLFLYAFLELADPRKQNKIFWASVAGLALGVGVQLHTLYILIPVLIFLFFSAYLAKKKVLKLRYAGVALLVALLLNLPQAVSEARTGFENTRNFAAGITQKSEKKNLFPLNVAMAGAWHVQSNMLFLSALGDDDDSDFEDVADDIEDNKKGIAEGIGENLPTLLRLGLGTTLSILGYFLFAYYIKKEEDEQRKIFLMMSALYVLVAFLVLVPLSHVLVLRYFLIVQFVPFILAGLIIKFLSQRYGVKAFYASLAALLFLGILNLNKTYEEFRDFARGKGDRGIAIWSEEKFAGEFITAHSKPGQEIYFVYEPQNANKFIRSLAYFNASIDAPSKPNSGDAPEGDNAAYFSLILNTKKEISMQSRRFKRQDKYEITDSDSLGRIMIYKLERRKDSDSGRK